MLPAVPMTEAEMIERIVKLDKRVAELEVENRRLRLQLGLQREANKSLAREEGWKMIQDSAVCGHARETRKQREKRRRRAA